MIRRLAVACGVVLATAGATIGLHGASAGGSAYPGENGLIVFARQTFVPFGFGLATVDPVTGVVSPLSNEFDSQPQWSPDGTRIVFASLRNTLFGDNQIYLMDADGGNVVNLTPTTDGNTCPTWSPDGTRVAYSDGPGNIVIIPSTGGAPLVTLAVDTCQLNWSPLGDLIAFEASTGISVVAPVNGASPTMLTTDPTDAQPSWSPDGAQVAFSRVVAGSAEIRVVDVATGVTRQVTSGGDDEAPGWSPDGTTISFSRVDLAAGEARVFTVPAAGGVATPLTTTPDVLDTDPDWQPLQAPPPPPPPPPTPPAPPTPVPVAPTFAG